MLLVVLGTELWTHSVTDLEKIWNQQDVRPPGLFAVEKEVSKRSGERSPGHHGKGSGRQAQNEHMQRLNSEVMGRQRQHSLLYFQSYWKQC